MHWVDVLFSPKGTLKQQPFAIVIIGIYALNLVAGSVLDGQFITRAGIWPYLGLQILLTWIWFVTHAKRLRDAGRGSTVAFIIAFIYLAGIILMVNLVSASSSALNTDPKEPRVSLIGTIIAVLFINTLFTGDVFLITALLILILGLPLLFSLMVVIYSIVTASRASLALEPQTLPPPLAPPAPSAVEKPRSPFA